MNQLATLARLSPNDFNFSNLLSNCPPISPFNGGSEWPSFLVNVDLLKDGSFEASSS